MQFSSGGSLHLDHHDRYQGGDHDGAHDGHVDSGDHDGEVEGEGGPVGNFL